MQKISRLQMGKHGLTHEFIEQVKNVFEHSKTIKISLLKSACRNKTEARRIANELIEKLGDTFSYRLVGYVITIKKFRRIQN